MKLEVLGKRTHTLHVKEEDVEKIPEENLINVSDPEPKPFPKPEPSQIAIAGKEEEHEKAWERYHAEKAEWEQHNAVPEGVKVVNAWVPVTKVHEVTMDGHPLKIYHTLRGPIIAAVHSEDMNRAFVFSPAMMDPNISRGRVHFLPVAFAGFKFTIYKGSCMGESIPQEAEIRGYPAFVNNNQKGDYLFRSKSAYHHIEADLPKDSMVASVELDVREAQEGLVPTSDTGEKKMVDRVRQVRALTEAAKAEEPVPVPQTTPPEGSAEAEKPPVDVEASDQAQPQEEASSA